MHFKSLRDGIFAIESCSYAKTSKCFLLGDNCWIGAGVIICLGVTIGENTVIGSGSVVVHDIPANVIAVGNPCRVVREIGEQDKVYYYKNRKIEEADLEEEKALR